MLSLSSRQLDDAAAIKVLRSRKAEGLTSLDLSKNTLNLRQLVLPALCSGLVQLNLSHNTLRELPDNISQLTMLQRLHLECCELTLLPITTGSLAFLKVLSLGGNESTLQFPPREVVAHGDEWTIDYLQCEWARHKQEQESRAHEAKEALWASSLERIKSARDVHDTADSDVIRFQGLINQVRSRLAEALSMQQRPDKPVVMEGSIEERIAAITRQELDEVRKLLRPPAAAQAAMEAVWVVVKQAPRSPTWSEVQKLLGADFKKMVLQYNASHTDEPLRKYVRAKYFQEVVDDSSLEQSVQRVARASLVCGVLWQWVYTMVSEQGVRQAETTERDGLIGVEKTAHDWKHIVDVYIQFKLERRFAQFTGALECAEAYCTACKDSLDQAICDHTELAERLGNAFVWAQHKDGRR